MADDERPAATRTKTTDSAILRVGEYGYPIGHLGHLTEHQAEQLEAFRQLCQDKGLYKPASDLNHSSHDDTTLLRFLRARRFDVDAAFQQFSETEKWREENKIGEVYENIDIKDYEETRVLYPQWTGRRDKRGIPVYVFEVAPLNSKTMSAYAKSSESTSVGGKILKSKGAATPPRLLRLFALYENLTNFILPLCSGLKDRQNSDTPISQSNNIVDISGVGLKQFWNLRSHMQDASTLATAHYPETLDRIFIIGAPSFFPTVWGWIKRWFDPITTSKIFILNEEKAYRTLSTFIEPSNIPKKYGGTLEYEFGMRPVLDPAEEQHIVWTSPDPIPSNQKWPTGPVKWIPQKDGSLLAMAVGSVDGKERREVIATFHPDGRENMEQAKTQTEPMQPIQPPQMSTEPTDTQTQPTQPGTQPIQTEARPVRTKILPVQTDAQPIHTEAQHIPALLAESEKIHQPESFQTPAVSVTNGAAQKPVLPQSPGEVNTLVNGRA